MVRFYRAAPLAGGKFFQRNAIEGKSTVRLFVCVRAENFSRFSLRKAAEEEKRGTPASPFLPAVHLGKR